MTYSYHFLAFRGIHTFRSNVKKWALVQISLLEVAATPESLHRPVCNQMRSSSIEPRKRKKERLVQTDETKQVNHHHVTCICFITKNSNSKYQENLHPCFSFYLN
jgi:hypothetical protein